MRFNGGDFLRTLCQGQADLGAGPRVQNQHPPRCGNSKRESAAGEFEQMGSIVRRLGEDGTELVAVIEEHINGWDAAGIIETESRGKTQGRS